MKNTLTKPTSTRWKNSDMPSVKILGVRACDLDDVDITILMMDYDSAKPDDPMGMCVLSFSNFIPDLGIGQCVITLSNLTRGQLQGKEPVVVDHDLVLWGKPAGHLCGKIFVYIPRRRDTSVVDFQHYVQAKAGCCNVL